MSVTAVSADVAVARADRLLETVDARTREILARRAVGAPHRRGWLVRRMLLGADVLGLVLAFAVATTLYGEGQGAGNRFAGGAEWLLFALALPVWIVLAKLHGLYDRDEERAAHTTVDDVVGVFQIVTIGAWLIFAGSWATGVATPDFPKLVTFWLLAIALVTAARAAARSYCRSSITYLQNTLIVGAGSVGQLVARKVLKHPEYGINLVGFVDSNPRQRRDDLGHVAVLGTPERLEEIIRLLDVERVIIAFSNERDEEVMGLVRKLRELDIQIDVVPRLYELVGPRVTVHTVEGLALVGLPPVRLAPSSRLLKRTLDVVAASLGLLLTAPFFAYAAWRIKRESPGPIFFGQTRLGLNMREFTALKFRTMKMGTDDRAHRDYIAQIMSSESTAGENGLYKLNRDDAVTSFGRWLRKTSLDELPQLINVIRGDMSLVGPRPCIPYETENFDPHHFERFLVPPGITGLWQVTARAHSSFGEALEMDVAYARGWSLGLDVRLLCRTPLELVRQRGATA